MVQSKRFDNGLRLVVKPMQGLFSVTMGIIVGTGAAFERDDEDGLSHFIEHVQFKGTKKRTAARISDDFDAIGAQVNAFTGKDITCYYSKSTLEHAEEAFEILSDMFLNATYPEGELDRERGVVLEEISMNEDTPDDLCLDLLAQSFYGNNSYGRSILGPCGNVKNFSVNDIRKYVKERYVPENTVISMAGDIDFERACDMVEKYFSSWKSSPFIQRDKQIETFHRSLIKNKPVEQVHIAITFPSFRREDKYSDALQIVNLVLGGGVSSRLFQEIREKSGLAYTVYSYTSAYTECGNLSVYAGVNDKNADLAYESILGEITKLKKDGITRDEFLKGREQMKSSMMFSQESTSSQMLLYGKYLLFTDRLFDFDDKLKSINSMREEDISECIKRNFDEEKMAVACVGNRKKAFDI